MKARIAIITLAFSLLQALSSTVLASTLTASIPEIFCNSHFSVVNTSNSFSIDMDKKPWECFTMRVQGVDLEKNPILSLSVKASETITMRVDISDADFISDKIDIISNTVEATGEFNTVVYDFTEILENVTLGDEMFLLIYIEPGKDFTGNVEIKNVIDNSNTTATSNFFKNDSKLLVYPSPASDVANISIPEGTYSNLEVYDIQGRRIYNRAGSFAISTTENIDVNTWSKGIYTVVLSSNSKKLTTKFMVN